MGTKNKFYLAFTVYLVCQLKFCFINYLLQLLDIIFQIKFYFQPLILI